MTMAGKFRKITALAGSLTLAGAAMLATAASARIPPRDPACDQRVANECVSTWQALGYFDYQHCVGYQQCMQCPPIPGYLCGMGPGGWEYGYSTEPNRDPEAW
jgi:hypothetical protein